MVLTIRSFNHSNHGHHGSPIFRRSELKDRWGYPYYQWSQSELERVSQSLEPLLVVELYGSIFHGECFMMNSRLVDFKWKLWKLWNPGSWDAC